MDTEAIEYADVDELADAERAAQHALESRLLLERIAMLSDSPELYMSLVTLDERMNATWDKRAFLRLVHVETVDFFLSEIYPDMDDPWLVLDPEQWWGWHRQPE